MSATVDLCPSRCRCMTCRSMSPSLYKRNRRWEVEGSRWDGLSSQAEREWLGRFNREWHDNSIGKDDPQAIHATDAQRKMCSDRGNSAYRDLHSILGSGLALLPIQPDLDSSSSFDAESLLIALEAEGAWVLPCPSRTGKLPRRS